NKVRFSDMSVGFSRRDILSIKRGHVGIAGLGCPAELALIFGWSGRSSLALPEGRRIAEVPQGLKPHTPFSVRRPKGLLHPMRAKVPHPPVALAARATLEWTAEDGCR